MNRSAGCDSPVVRSVSDPQLGRRFALDQAYRIPGRHFQLFGAVWHPNGYLLIADFGRDAIWFWQPGGFPKAFRRPAGGPATLYLDPAQRLIVYERHLNTVTRTDPDGAVVILLETDRLGSNVEVASAVADGEGNLYVALQSEAVAGFGTKGKHTLLRVAPDRSEEQFGHEIDSPLAVTWSETQRALWVVAAPEGTVWRISRANDGWKAEKFTSLWQDENVEYAGIDTHPDGTVAVASKQGVHVLADGRELIGRLELVEPPSACSWGGPHGPHDLVVTAGCYVYILPGRQP